jgi:lysophospholipase L1-like esterase
MVSMRSVPVLAALLLAVTACGGGGSDSASEDAPDGPRYVALGDSFTAGPGIAPVDSRSEDCERSTLNYPRLVAKAIDAASFTDVSCTGATSDNVLETVPIPSGTTPVKAQLEAVTPDTQLVTVGIGGNDSGLFSSLSSACTQQGDACADYFEDKLPTVLRSTRRNVTNVLAAVADRAPDAKVVLVGYLRVVPEDRGCDNLGGAALDTGRVADGEVKIDAMMAAAAKNAGATYVSMNDSSEGHDACNTDAWTNGLAPALGNGISLHPRKIGMEQVARAVEQAVA